MNQKDLGQKFYLAGVMSKYGDSSDTIAVEIDHKRIFSAPINAKSFVASDSSVDRHEQFVNVNGWVLTYFKQNPVMLWSHDARIPAIGTWENIRLEDIKGEKRLVMDEKFDKGQGDPFADLIAGKVERGVIKMVSVGFIPLEFDRDFNVLKQELVEVSIVNIGANRNALNNTKPEKKEVKKQNILQMEESYDTLKKKRMVANSLGKILSK